MRLDLDKNFQPCPTEDGDEFYPNGIFTFNITRMLAYIASHSGRFAVELVKIADIPAYGSAEGLDADTIRAANCARPIVLAEISPGRYNVIDGNHRVAKAMQEGLGALPAFRVNCPDHLAFLTSTSAYEKYVEYWNLKRSDLLKDSQRSS